MKLYHVMYGWMGALTRVQNFWGHCPLKIWEGKKTSKIWRDFRQLSTLTANIPGRDDDINKH